MPRPKLDKKSETVRVQLVTTAKWLARVTRWGKKQTPPQNTSESIRRLVDSALDPCEKHHANADEHAARQAYALTLHDIAGIARAPITAGQGDGE